MINSDDLINKVKSYNKFLNPDTLTKAYEFALKAHKHQKRHSGDPYVIHPVAVADILTDLNSGYSAKRFNSFDKLFLVDFK